MVLSYTTMFAKLRCKLILSFLLMSYCLIFFPGCSEVYNKSARAWACTWRCLKCKRFASIQYVEKMISYSLLVFFFFFWFSFHSCNSSYILTICNIIEEILSSKSSSHILNSLIQVPCHLLFSIYLSHLSLEFLGQCPYILTLRKYVG